jgi:hypothetical protein
MAEGDPAALPNPIPVRTAMDNWREHRLDRLGVCFPAVAPPNSD